MRDLAEQLSGLVETRAIRLDKSWLKRAVTELMKDVEKTSARYVKSGRGGTGGNMAPLASVVVGGHPGKIHGEAIPDLAFYAYNTHAAGSEKVSRGTFHHAGESETDRKFPWAKGLAVVTVGIPSNYLRPSRITNKVGGQELQPAKLGKDLLRGLMSVLSHEVTHYLDWLYGQKKEFDPRTKREKASGARFIGYSSDPYVYHNTPTEVRAFMRQVVDEVISSMKSGVSMEKSILVSATWTRINKFLNSKNRRKFLKAIATAARDAGL